MKQRGIFYGLIVFAVALLANIFVSSLLQYYLGSFGLALGEALFGVIAILFIYFFGLDIKSVLTYRLPSIGEFFAAFVTFLGFYTLALSVSSFISAFSTSLEAYSENITAVATSMSPLTAVIVIALLPAIFEEMLFRGLIQYCFAGIENEYLRFFLVGLLFGIMHIYPSKIAITLIIGIGAALIREKTDSILLCTIFHFLVNLMSVYAIFKNAQAAESAAIPPSSYIITGFIYLAFSIPIILFGIKKLNSIEENKKSDNISDK